MTIALARENPGYYINACCPGWVSTDLGNQAGTPPKTVGKQRLCSPFCGYSELLLFSSLTSTSI